MVAGFFWRGADFALRRGERDLHWARKGFHFPHRRWQIDSYTMHAGLLVVMFGFAPHILFIGDDDRDSNGRACRSRSSSGPRSSRSRAMLAVLVHRVMMPEPSIFSAFDDYFTWSAVFIAMLTGLVCYPHVGGAPAIGPYGMLLTAHLIAVELLMVWLPFGKLIHVAFMPFFQVLGAIRQFVVKLHHAFVDPQRY